MKKVAVIGTTDNAFRLIHNFEDTGFAKVVGFIDDYIEPGEIRRARPRAWFNI